MSEKNRNRVDRFETFALRMRDKGLGYRDRLEAKGRFTDLLARHAGPFAIADDDQIFPEAQLLRRDDRAVDSNLVGLRRRIDVVGQFDFRDDETILTGEF